MAEPPTTPATLLVATGNPGKLREFRQMLGDQQFDWRDLSSFDSVPQVDETGRTFRENACLKASTYARHLRLWTIADDSGLEVDALGGAPGALSARWAEVNSAGRGDADNNTLLLRQLEEIPDARRTARFVCVLAVARPDGRLIATVRDTVEGRIIRQPRGRNGFGYDPLFLVDSLDKTTAELESAHKHQISHRGKALRQMREILDRLNIPPP